MDNVLVRYDANFNKLITLLCQSKVIFRKFFKLFANKQISLNFPKSYQRFLVCLLTMIRDQMKLSEYQLMYDDELYSYILMMSDETFNDGDGNKIVRIMLGELMNNNETCIDFILLATHFPLYIDMIDHTITNSKEE